MATKLHLDPSITSAWQTPSVASRYKAAENATRPFAQLMVAESERIATIKDTPVTILDLACGTGAVEAEIYRAVPKAEWKDLQLLAADISAPMLAYVQERGAREGWSGLATRVVDGTKLAEYRGALGAEAASPFAHIFVGFAVFVLPPDTIAQLATMLKAGGSLAVSTWADLPWYKLLAKTYAQMQEGPRLPSEDEFWSSFTNGRAWCDASFVKEQLEQAGLKEVVLVQRKFNVDCGTPETFMTAVGFMLGMLSKQWSEDVRDRWLKEVGETMKEILIEEVGGVDRHVFMDFEGIVGVGLKE